MTYEVIIDGELEKKFKKIRDVNFKEYSIVTRKIDEIKEYSKVTLNHKTKFNTFEKPLDEYKWVKIGNKILKVGEVNIQFGTNLIPMVIILIQVMYLLLDQFSIILIQNDQKLKMLL